MIPYGVYDPLRRIMMTLTDELELLQAWTPLAGARLIELGCGAAGLARQLVATHAGSHVTGLEVDERQHAKNLAAPAPGLAFMQAGAEAIPFGDGAFDGALMLKSLHHVPAARLDDALTEVRRVLRPEGWLYVSEPVYAGALNEVMKLFNDEGEVRAGALAALLRALAGGGWAIEREQRFDVPVHFAGIEAFEQRMVNVTFAERHLSEAVRAELRARLAPHLTADGLHFTRPMQAFLLRRR